MLRRGHLSPYNVFAYSDAPSPDKLRHSREPRALAVTIDDPSTIHAMVGHLLPSSPDAATSLPLRYYLLNRFAAKEFALYK